MAYWKNTKKNEPAMCPICRQMYTNGAVVEYDSKNPAEMCKDCFNRGYKSGKDRNIVSIDTPANFAVQFRPAPILERPKFKKKEAPECGYEYAIPQITEYQLIRDRIIWIVLLLILSFIVKQNGDYISTNNNNVCLTIIYIIQFIWSLCFCISDFKSLIKGILYGMGHTRRIILLITGGTMAYMTWTAFTMIKTAVGL